jgi:hypothetical protein
MTNRAPKKKQTALDKDDARLLATLAKSPAMWPGSAADAARLDLLVKTGYLVRDPNLKAATFRLTIRGWASVRHMP